MTTPCTITVRQYPSNYSITVSSVDYIDDWDTILFHWVIDLSSDWVDQDELIGLIKKCSTVEQVEETLNNECETFNCIAEDNR